ncbi:MAG TPA: polyprenyl synthetase family protein [Salinivirgaceae bacterium]|nr:polyprenyl synthetase family protein [Salinivirgaceae bacterium]
MNTLDILKNPIKNELSIFEKRFRENVLAEGGTINTILGYLIQRKGKQLRPLLVLLSAGACGEINDKTYTAATFVELMHTATLIHDDVVDDSHMRRNFLTINSLWKNKIAVLVGDYLLARGLLLAVKKGEYAMLETISEAVDMMSRGEILQIKKSRQLNITEEEYFEIIRQKTASLIAACTKIGAQSATDNPELLENMYQFGLNLGIAFQIRDDLFDYEAENQTGKPSGNDIQEKKLTLPLIFTRNKSNWRQRRKLLKIIKSKRSAEYKLANIVTLVDSKGGFDYAQREMLSYKEKALSHLEKLPDSEYKKSLVMLVDYVIDRKQ